MQKPLSCVFFLLSMIVPCLLGFVNDLSAQEVPRPEFPNPQMQRSDWLSLNGSWDFAECDGTELYLGDALYPDQIIVPFCRESELSGLGRTGFVKNVWYRRSFTLPNAWEGKHVLFHIGAGDWKSTLYINDRPVGVHEGGSTPLRVDITDALQSGENVAIIHVFDDTVSGLQACGKQSQRAESYGCLYTRTTGIWQSVWLEAVGKNSIERFEAVADLDKEQLHLKVILRNAGEGKSLSAIAKAEDREAARSTVTVQDKEANLTLTLPEARPWKVSDPFLYDLELILADDGTTVDHLYSYFAMRQIEIKGRALLLNGEAVFQRLVLDQGFYPDGIWTAPTEDALKNDILLSMAAGFNGARLHQKVFEPRFLYWADKLGYLVWGEYPNWGLDHTNEIAQKAMMDEWEAVVQRDFNHPSIIGWCPFNETTPEAAPLQNKVMEQTRRLDPTRPVLETSGYVHAYNEAMLLDAHDYDQNPETFRERWAPERFEMPLPKRYNIAASIPVLPFFISEYGGIGWNLNPEAWGYGDTPKSLEAFYKRYEQLTQVLLDNAYMFGYCYTQLTNIEQEQNGIYNYDRSSKFDVTPIRNANRRVAAYESNPPLDSVAKVFDWQVLVGAEPDGENAARWRYTENTPPEGWEQPDFKDTDWQSGKGAFGHKEGFEAAIHTPWKSDNIWLRSSFNYAGEAFEKAVLIIHYDNDTTVYLNGSVLFSATKWNDAYARVDLSERVKELLKTGENTVAVHTWQDTGGQFIDLALLLSISKQQ